MAKLIVGNSLKNMELYYAIHVKIPDTIIYLEKGKKKIVVVGDFEVARVKKENPKLLVFPLSKYNDKKRCLITCCCEQLLLEENIRKITVNKAFPVKIADALRKKKIKFHIVESLYDRTIKNAAEIKEIKRIAKYAHKAMHHAINIIKKSNVKNNTLWWKKKKLTSEMLKAEIAKQLLDYNIWSRETIVSCGKQSALPHNLGKGPLKAHQPIIIDIFPKSYDSMYFYDFTRTVCKGKAPEKLKKMYYAVLEAQKTALSSVKAGMKVSSLMNIAQRVLEKHGFRTTKEEGFIHSLGHGVGLQIHESPRVSIKSGEILKTGTIITIEPGLYYKNIGGVRIEDTIVITNTGCENLTKIMKILEV